MAKLRDLSAVNVHVLLGWDIQIPKISEYLIVANHASYQSHATSFQGFAPILRHHY